ncbi:MAG: hypothetical protein Q8N81_03830 [bacterium]|nr:hypothetical protein [bacterium]
MPYRIPFTQPQQIVVKIKVCVSTAVELMQAGVRMQSRRRDFLYKPKTSGHYKMVYEWPEDSRDRGVLATVTCLRQEIESQYHRYLCRPPRILLEETVIEDQVTERDHFLFLVFEPVTHWHAKPQACDQLIAELLASPLKRIKIFIDTKELKFKLALYPAAFEQPAEKPIEFHLRKDFQLQPVCVTLACASEFGRLPILALA